MVRFLVGLVVFALVTGTASAAPAVRTIGQPTIDDTTLATRCPSPNARFGFRDNGGFEMFGPAGIAMDPRGRLFVTDFAGGRVLSWPDIDAVAACTPGEVIGAGDLAGPESVAVDPNSETVFIADTLDHTVKGYRNTGGGWTKVVTLGTPGVPGTGMDRMNFPRGLALDARGRLFVADDFNKRVLIFDAPFSNGEAAADSIGAGANGGFGSPKAVAVVGETLFVADWSAGRVLRFTGPFQTPEEVYVASGVFSGLIEPVDVAIHPDGSLLVTEQGRTRVARYADAVIAPSTATPTSSFADGMGLEPLGVAADRRGRVYVADYRRFRVLVREERVRTAAISTGATAATKALLADFNARGGRSRDRIALGQQLITWEYGRKSNPKAWYGDWLQLENSGLSLPKIMGGELSDLMTYPGFSPNKPALAELIRHGKAGHVVTLVWHPDNPVPNAAFGTPISTAALKSLRNPATTAGKRWRTQLDRAAAVLERFRTAGVPVLFRPMHEQNGDFFWWGHDGSTGATLRERQAAWVGLWRDMTNTLVVNKKLNNLVFVFGTNQINYDGVAAPLTYYPGAGHADVVSIDIYDEQLDLAGSRRGKGLYTALISTGKPFGLSEVGQSFGDKGTGANASRWDARTLATRVRDSYARTAFAVFWYSSTEGDPPRSFIFALPDVSFADRLIADPLIDTQ